MNLREVAVFPAALIEPCVLAGSRPGDVVLDPFGGSCITGEVAERLGRKWVCAELVEASSKQRIELARSYSQARA